MKKTDAKKSHATVPLIDAMNQLTGSDTGRVLGCLLTAFSNLFSALAVEWDRAILSVQVDLKWVLIHC